MRFVRRLRTPRGCSQAPPGPFLFRFSLVSSTGTELSIPAEDIA